MKAETLPDALAEVLRLADRTEDAAELVQMAGGSVSWKDVRFIAEEIRALAPAIRAMADDARRSVELLGAGKSLRAAMHMQERREAGELHLSQPAAKHYWDTSKNRWDELTKPAAIDALNPIAKE